MAVHVRLERGHRVDLDDRDAAAGAAGSAREPLSDPAVADDAELAAREAQVRQPVDRSERRLAGAVAVVEQVLAEGVVGGDRREGETSRRRHRPQPGDAGRRLLGHAGKPRRHLGPVLDDPRGQLGAVVDDDLGLRVGDREQVGIEMVLRGPVPRVHLDPARNECRANRVLGRAGIRAGGDDVCACVGEQRCEVGRLCLEVDDDGDAPAAQRPVGKPLAREPIQDGRVLGDPADPLLALGGERRIGNAGARGGIHVVNLAK